MGRNYYRILGFIELFDPITDDNIARRYRNLALKFHPEINRNPGAEEKFKEIAEAYEVLSDTKMREVYDNFGEAGLKGGATPDGESLAKYTYHGDPYATFAKFFGTAPLESILESNPCPDSELSRDEEYYVEPEVEEVVWVGPSYPLGRSPTIKHDVYVSPVELTMGCTKMIEIAKRVVQPDGTTRVENKVLTIEVEPGTPAGTKEVFQMEGDQEPNKRPADIVFTIIS